MKEMKKKKREKYALNLLFSEFFFFFPIIHVERY